MNRFAFCLAMLVAGLCQASWAATFSGTVTDSLGNALEGAEVSLVLSDRRTTTDALGGWTLGWSTTDVSERTSLRSAARWTGSAVEVNLPSVSSVKIEAYSLAGVLVGHAKTVSLGAGLHRIPMFVPASAGAWLRITINGRSETLHAGLGRSFEPGGRIGNRAARVEVVPDTLRFAWNGVVVFQQALNSLPTSRILTRIDTAWKPADSYGIPWNGTKTYGSLTYGGQTYRTVRIGRQTWMAENLNYKAADPDTGRYYYADIADSAKKYGRLYSWASLMKLPDSCNTKACADLVQPKHQGICPTGWHVPRLAEWDTLESAVGGRDSAGARLKSNAGWKEFGNGTDAYGFRALPGGGFYSGSYTLVGGYGTWWSAREKNAEEVWNISTNFAYAVLYRYNSNKTDGFSARCLED